VLFEIKILVLWLRCCVVLWVDTDVSEEYAASNMRVQVCRFTNRLGNIANLKERWSWDPRRGDEGITPVGAHGKKQRLFSCPLFPTSSNRVPSFTPSL
jgi:hypothetical protein